MKSDLNEKERPKIVEIFKKPTTIDLREIAFEPVIKYPDNSKPQGKCLFYALEVAKKNPGVEIIEGSVVFKNKNNEWSIFSHAWNRIGILDFDVTAEEVWEKDEEFESTNQFKYASTISYFPAEKTDQDKLELITIEVSNSMIDFLETKADAKNDSTQ